MLVVLAIVSILAGLITVAVMAAKKASKIKFTEARIKLIEAYIQSYHTDFNEYPRSAGEDPVLGNERLLEQLRTDDKNGPYLKMAEIKTVDSNGNGIQEIADDFNQPLQYLYKADYNRAKPNRDSYRLWSMGPDGVSDPMNPGSDDILNWDKTKPDAD